jgi:hypothetical protein
MTVQLPISYETLVDLIEQLPQNQLQDLFYRLAQITGYSKLNPAEKMKILRSAQLNLAVNQEPSARREVWYDDDGR